MKRQRERIRDAKKYDKFDYKVGSKSELLSFAVALVLLIISFIPVLADFPRDILRLICAVLSSYPFIIDAFYGLKEKKIKKSLLIISVVIIAMFIGRFEQTAAVAVLFRLYDFFEKLALNKSREDIDKTSSLISDTAHAVREEGGFEIIDPSSIMPGMKLAVLAGETVPVDGIVTEGVSSLDYSEFTGETVHRKAAVGDKILSGAVNGNSVLLYKALCSQSESVSQRIADSVKRSSSVKTSQEKKVKLLSFIFTAAGIFVALSVGIIGSIATKEPFEWLHRGLTVLASLCPSVYFFGTVSSVYSSIGAGSKKGIIYKNGDVFEKIRKTSGVIFEGASLFENDKTVTGDIFCSDGYPASDVLRIAAKCYYSNASSAAKAIIASAGEFDAEDVTECEILENGVRAVISDGVAVCGGKDLMESLGIDSDGFPDYDIYVSLNNIIIGCIEICKEIKKSAVSAVSVLKSNDIPEIYCYCDEYDEGTKRTAAEVGIKDYFHGESEAKKLFSEMIKNGKAVFVADDNGNHKLLSRADISVFCGEDNLRKNEAADIVAVQKEPMRVVDALMLGAKSAGIMRINVFSALILKLIVIVLGITGIVPVFTAVVADIAALSICFINIIRIKKQR